MIEDHYYITTPIYYANAAPHIGHAYTSVAADTIARTMRLRGYKVIFLTGTDEHGLKVERAAKSVRQDPKTFTDEVSRRFMEMGTLLHLSNHQFIRTTEEHHKRAAQAFWQKISASGFIYKGTYSGWYSVQDEAFYESSELVTGKAPTGASVEWLEEPSYFFRLSAFQDSLLGFYRENPRFIEPPHRMNEVLRFVERGLCDLSISRSSVTWGIPVPGDEANVMYVWVDALVSYLTAVGYPDVSGSIFSTFWQHATHVFGKDILLFHGVYWVALLMAAGITLPKCLWSHGWWTGSNRQKISKSLGDRVDLQSLVNNFGVDQVRYFLIRGVPFGRDGTFSEAALIRHVNADLSNNFGNLVQRVLSFIYDRLHATIPMPGPFTSADDKLVKMSSSSILMFHKLEGNEVLHEICNVFLTTVTEANRYLEIEKPWNLGKINPKRMGTILYVMSIILYHLAVLISPLMPEVCKRLLDDLSVPEQYRSLAALYQSVGLVTPLPGTRIPEPKQLFPRIRNSVSKT